jgi:tetratricopeptide (TPR) repeat protein
LTPPGAPDGPRVEQPFVTGRAPEEGARRRLARLSRWCVGDRLAAAELELSEWLHAPDCPAQAAVLLASLLARSNRHALALSVIDQQLAAPRESEPVLLCMLIALHAVTGNDEAAAGLTHRLHREHGHDPRVMRWLATLRAPMTPALPAVSDATIDQLAGELLDRIEVIPSLVAALRIERQERTIVMLRGAITQMLRDIDEEPAMLIACQALADLAMLAGDHDDARRWAHRGLRLDPYAARLAIILSQVADDAAVGPPASTVLKEAVSAHPKYPDLRAALIRREFAQGRIEVARRRLRQWLTREPNQPMAIRLQDELAA